MILQLLDVLVGLTVVYLIFATATSTAVDLIEVWLRRRGRLLERGIGEIFAQTLGDADTARTLVRTLYESPFVYSLYEGRYQPQGRRLPSAIPPTRFAGALIALAKDHPPFAQSTSRMLAVAGLTLDSPPDAVRAAIAGYYQESMDRVSGWYRRHVQIVLFILGFGLAAAINADTLQIVRTLSQNPALREAIVKTAVAQRNQPLSAGTASCAPDDTACDAERERQLGDQLQDQLGLAAALGLPLGWNQPRLPACQACGVTAEAAAYWSGKLAGLLLTALATTLGAPFWFDLLNKLLSLRDVLRARGTTSR